MIIANKKEEFKQFLKEEYQEKIQGILADARQEKKQEVALAKQTLTTEQKEVLEKQKRVLEQEELAKVSSASTKKNQEVTHAYQELRAAVDEELEKAIAKLPQKSKETIAKYLLEKVKASIESEKKYTLHCWKGIKDKGVKADLDILGAQAVADDQEIVVSIADELAQRNQEIEQHLRKL